MSTAKSDTPAVKSGIKYLGRSDSYGACIVKFWIHGEGWEYRVERAWLYKIEKMAARGGGVAFNWCKAHAIETYGPYDNDWRLIRNELN